MIIADNIIKAYLKNVYFINGTAYAGKSTQCKLLSEKYGLLLCGENYDTDLFSQIATLQEQPNMCYFRTMRDWQEFIHRTPQEYAAWIKGNSDELAEFEIAQLIRLSAHQKVIVDTNIPAEILTRIADYNQVAIMLSPQAMSVDRFFDREDPEKQFLLEQIHKAPDPQGALENFRACLTEINSPKVYESWRNSGFFTLIREHGERDTRQETTETLARHFGLA